MPEYDKRRLDQKFKDVFGTPDGREVLHELCKFCHLMRATYSTESSTDNMLFREGERNVGMYILNRINVHQLDMINEISEGKWR